MIGAIPPLLAAVSTPMDYRRVTMTDRGGLGELQHSACVASAR